MEGRDFPTLERRGPENKLPSGIQFEDPVPSLGRPVESIRDLPAKKLVSSISRWMAALRLIPQCSKMSVTALSG